MLPMSGALASSGGRSAMDVPGGSLPGAFLPPAIDTAPGDPAATAA